LREASTGDLIALYGSLLRGLGAMKELGILDRVRFVGPCLLEGQLFDLGDYPGMRHGAGQVVGEIYTLLDLEALRIMDRFEDFDVDQPRESIYLRESIRLIEPAGAEAWVYIYNRIPDPSGRIAGGDWRAHWTQRADPTR